MQRTKDKVDHQHMEPQSCHFKLPPNVPHVLKMNQKFLDKVDAQLLASSKEKYALRMKAAEECSSDTADSDHDCDCDSGHPVSTKIFPNIEEMNDAYLKLASHCNEHS